MRRSVVGLTASVLLVCSILPARLIAEPGPWDGSTFRGRIAYSADGNHNDPDDWAASPVSLAILAESGLKDRLVHFHYNCILPLTNPEWELIHADSVLGAAEHYGYDKSIFFDCRTELDEAVADVTRMVNESSAEDPLYFIVAGPMQVPVMGILKSDPNKRRHVYCISHSNWNDGLVSRYEFTHTKRDVIETGVNWVQIPDQNRGLARSRYGKPARPEEFRDYFWMRDATDPKVRFLWERTVVSTRPDPSDAGMTYFLATGDVQATPEKLKRLILDHAPPEPIGARSSIRLEAENFVTLDGYEVKIRDRKVTSHGVVAKSTEVTSRISGPFSEPYAPPTGTYDVEIRHADEENARPQFTLSINGKSAGAAWRSSGTGKGWVTHRIAGVEIASGDTIEVASAGASAQLDYVQLNVQILTSSADDRSAGVLDDPDALPGQIIVAGSNPGYLKYNGGGPAFLCGPDNPEDFLYRGTLNPDGTRSGGQQEQMIERLAEAGVNAFHCQMFRMQRCNYKNEGDDTHCPFIGHDPSQGLNENVLEQWDGWLDLFEQHEINVHLEFYNDATDVERMGWTLDADGNLPEDERRWIAGVVNRFKHHKNILWGVEESCNKLSRERTAHFKKIGQLIARTDKHHHPIVQSFVVPNDPEGDFPEDGLTSDEYLGDPHVRVVTWLHFVPHGDDIEKQHAEYLSYYHRDAADFVVMKNETYHHPKTGPRSRKYMWACAMTGMHCLEAYHHADDTPDEILREDGYINRFLERTPIHTMRPHDELASGSTKWVLANPGRSYVAYTYDYAGPMGVTGLAAGTYQVTWLDTVNGRERRQQVNVEESEATLSKPAGFGQELAVFLIKTDD